MDRVSVRRAGLGALLAAVLIALAPGLAQAVQIKKSDISAPANNAFVFIQEGAKLTVSGTVERGTAVVKAEGVNIVCYWTPPGTIEPEEATVAENVPVSYVGVNGTFSAELLLSATEDELQGEADEAHTCTLRALPATGEPEELAPFEGPAVILGEFAQRQIGAAGKQHTDNFEAITNQPGGYAAFESFSSLGLVEAMPLTLGGGTFTAGGSLFETNDSYPATLISSTRSSVQVDGANAYGPASAAALFGNVAEVPGFPEVTASAEPDAATGGVTVHESEPLKKCNSEPTYPPEEGVCTEFVATGVTLGRTIIVEKGGQAVISDSFSSADKAAHTLSLRSLEAAAETSAQYQFPWVSSSYGEHKAGDVVTAPPSSPASVFLSFNNELEDTEDKGALGAITFAQAPGGLEFVEPGRLSVNTDLVASYQQTVPACEPLAFTQVFSWAFKKSEAATLASAPTLSSSITSPASESVVSTRSVTVSGTVTPSPSGYPATVDVDCKAVAVGAEGAWSTSVPLAGGVNTITATALDDGEGASAQITVTHPETQKEKEEREKEEREEREAKEKAEREAKEKAEHEAKEKAEREAKSAGTGAAVPSSAPSQTTASATVKATSNGHEVQLTIACAASGATCSGKASVTAKIKVTVKTQHGHKTKTKMITVASGSFTIEPGKSKTIKLKLTSTASKELARLSSLATTITLTLTEPEKATSSVTAHLTVHKPKPKPKKKH